MRAFIASAQQWNPTIPASLHNYIVAKYVEKRKLQYDNKNSDHDTDDAMSDLVERARTNNNDDNDSNSC